MGTVGSVTIIAEADVSEFAAELQRRLRAAVNGIDVDASRIGNRIRDGVSNGADQALRSIDTLSTESSDRLRTVGDAGERAGQDVADSLSDAGRDGASGISDGADSARTSLDSVGDASSRMANEVSSASERASSSIVDSMQSAGDQMSSVGESMTTALTLPLAGIGVAVATVAGDFEASMNNVQAVSGATADEIAQMRDVAIEMGTTTQYSATQAADAMGFLAMAGFDATESMEALPGVLNLAAAGSLELADAADIASNILSGYGFEASDLADVNDVLAKTFTSTNTTLEMLGESFKYVGPVASSAGISFEEASAAIGLLGNAGIQGSEAGTALRGALARLLDPTAEVTSTLGALGVQVTDSSGALLPLVDIIGQLEAAGATTTDMMRIFGVEAGPAMQSLVSQGSDALGQLVTDLENAGGTAETIAATKMEGLNGALSGLRSAAEGLLIAIGDAGLLGWMTSLTGVLTDLTSAAANANPIFLQIGTVVGVVVAAIGPLMLIVGQLTSAFATAWKYLKPVGQWFARLGPLLMGVSAPVWGVIAAVAAVVAIFVVAYQKSEAFRDIVSDALSTVGDVASALWTGAIQPAFSAIQSAISSLIGFFQQLVSDAAPVGEALGDAFLTGVDAVTPALGTLADLAGQVGEAVMGLWTSTLQPFVSWVVSAFSGLGGAISEWWTANGASVFQQAASMITWFAETIGGPVLSGFMTVLTTVATVLVNVFTGVIIPAIQAAGAVISWLWSTIAQPVFTALTAILGVIMTVVQALMPVFTAVFTAIGAVVSVVWSILSPIFTAIGTVIGVIITVVQTMWSIVSPIFTALGELVMAVWTGYLSVVFSAIQLAFQVLVAAVQVWWAAFTAAWNAVSAVIQAVYNAVIVPVIEGIKSLFSAMMDFLQPVFDRFKSAFQAVGDRVSEIASWIREKITSLRNAVSNIMSALADAVNNAITRVKNAANGIADFVSKVKEHFQNAVNAVKDKMNDMVSKVKEIPGKIKSAIGNAGDILKNAGKQIIQGLINGIKSKISSLKNTLSGIASTIRGYMPFSPAKEGPLSGHGDPTNSGASIVSMIAKGMEGNLRTLRSASADVASTAGLSDVKTGAVGGTGGQSITLAAGAVQVVFSGVVPTESEAASTGEAVASGLIAQLTKARTRTLVGSI